MNGIGFIKGMMVTLRHFVNTYVDDLRYGFKKYSPDVDNFEVRQGTKAAGAFTVQYPEEKVAMPERFRFVPFLVVNDYDHPEAPGKDWCTSCGICAKVCPPQCIWIVRSNDPVTGRPVPEPEAFFIDIDICMNCGYCAEFCPFDAIKMDIEYELSDYGRIKEMILDKERLTKPDTYHAAIHPTDWARELADKAAEEEKKRRAEEAKAKAAAAKAAAPAKPASAPPQQPAAPPQA